MAGNTVENVRRLVQPVVENLGLSLWDVRFVKEGASWFLRIFIDKADGITINDCTEVSHAVDPILDEADPIDVSYYLEVCSPGVERELTRPEHYKAMLGKTVQLTLYKAVDGSKNFTGQLIGYSDGPKLQLQDEMKHFVQSSVSKARLIDSET